MALGNLPCETYLEFHAQAPGDLFLPELVWTNKASTVSIAMPFYVNIRLTHNPVYHSKDITMAEATLKVMYLHDPETQFEGIRHYERRPNHDHALSLWWADIGEWRKRPLKWALRQARKDANKHLRDLYDRVLQEHVETEPRQRIA